MMTLGQMAYHWGPSARAGNPRSMWLYARIEHLRSLLGSG
jgi:hypothetical protein